MQVSPYTFTEHNDQCPERPVVNYQGTPILIAIVNRCVAYNKV